MTTLKMFELRRTLGQSSNRLRMMLWSLLTPEGYRLSGCGVEDAPRWVGVSGFHGAESWGTSGDLELVCNEAMLSRGRGTGEAFHDRGRLFWLSGFLNGGAPSPSWDFTGGNSR